MGFSECGNSIAGWMENPSGGSTSAPVANRRILDKFTLDLLPPEMEFQSNKNIRSSSYSINLNSTKALLF